MNTYHTSVLLTETIDLLQIKQGEKYIDATLGGGGHTCAILERGGIVLGLDVDQEALDYVEWRNKGELFLVKGNFVDLDTIALGHGFNKVAGILFDLGVSSHQFDTAERGFSFQKEGLLDMRMDRDQKVKAVDLINILTKGELNELFTKLGEEHFARSIAGAIIRARRVGPIKTTSELRTIIRRAVPKVKTHIDPSTRVFQALRIAVNDELNNLREGLSKAVNLLEERGRIAVITFHSLEDRIVKQMFLDWESKGIGTLITAKPIIPGVEEVTSNPRSRSSKLRVFEKA